MVVKYVGNNIIQTVHGNLGKGKTIEVDENSGAVLLKMRDKNGNKMFEEVVEKKKEQKEKKAKKAKKVKMIIDEREGE